MVSIQPRISRTTLGMVLIAVGLFVLVDIALVARISALLIAGSAIVAGAFQIVHGFWKRDASGFPWRALLGALYIGFGVAIIMQPGVGAPFMHYVLGLVLAASGASRIVMGIRERGSFVWMILSGVFGIAAGVAILSGWPMSGIRFIAAMLGLDLVTHGVAWLTAAWRHPEPGAA